MTNWWHSPLRCPHCGPHPTSHEKPPMIALGDSLGGLGVEQHPLRAPSVDSVNLAAEQAEPGNLHLDCVCDFCIWILRRVSRPRHHSRSMALCGRFCTGLSGLGILSKNTTAAVSARSEPRIRKGIRLLNRILRLHSLDCADSQAREPDY